MMTKYIHIDDEFWDEIEVGENIVIYHNGEEENIVVPEELGGQPVTRIGKLKPTDEVKSITIPKTVTVIEDDAFDGFPEDFVIYCYPTTQYSNKDGYTIVYLEETVQEDTQEESESEQSNISSEQAINEETEEVTEIASETSATEPKEVTSVSSIVLFAICVFLGLLLLLKRNKDV